MPVKMLPARSPQTNAEIRWLPPGSIYDHWRQFSAVAGGVCSYFTFWSTWKSQFNQCLKFRTGWKHAVCAACVKHKMLLRQLAHDSAASHKQRLLYDRHLQGQFADRQVYWSFRASSRLRSKIITLILDGMDQAKFMIPRSPIFRSHEFDGFHRPRAHCVGCICHGYFVDIFISDADVKKSGSNSVEIIHQVLARLASLIDLSDCELVLQMDNAANQNKNNIVFAYLACLVACGIVTTAMACFLRTGHTHEDIDQLVGQLASYLIKHCHIIETLPDMAVAIRKFLAELVRHHEPKRFVTKLDQTRDWKAFFAALRKTITGIKGPGAPHLFHFLRRSG